MIEFRQKPNISNLVDIFRVVEKARYVSREMNRLTVLCFGCTCVCAAKQKLTTAPV